MDCCVLFDQIEASAVSSRFAVIQERPVLLCFVESRRVLKQGVAKYNSPLCFLVGLRFWCVFIVFFPFCYCCSLCCCRCWPQFVRKYIGNRAVLNGWSCFTLNSVSYEVCCHLIPCLCFVEARKGLKIRRFKI